VFSAGTDGSVHGWDLPSGHRIDELGGLHSNSQVLGIAVAVPAVSFSAAVVGLKLRNGEVKARATEITAAERAAERIAAAKAAATATAVALCWDGSLREISWRHPPAKVDRGGANRKTIGGQILKEEGPELHYSTPVITAEEASSGMEVAAAAALNNGRSFITCIVRCKTKPFLIAGAANGCIHVYAWPLQFPVQSHHHHHHHHHHHEDEASLDGSQASDQVAKQLMDAAASDQLPPHLEIEGHSCSVETMSLSINDTLLFTGGADGTVSVISYSIHTHMHNIQVIYCCC
jgi:WD40 repeat protein